MILEEVSRVSSHFSFLFAHLHQVPPIGFVAHTYPISNPPLPT
jgi:hypothetical protein